MEKAKVYFTDFRTKPNVSLTEKLQKLCRRAGIAAEPIRNSQLGDHLAQPDWHHHHDPFQDNHPNTSWRETLAHAEKIGLGTREYELIRI